MKKFFLVVAFGAFCGILGYGYANGNIHADNMVGVARR